MPKMRNLVVTLLVLCCTLPLFGQTLHTPAEIFEIMDKSSVVYELHPLETQIMPVNRTNNLNVNDSYRVEDASQIWSHEYEIDSVTESYYKQAEAYYHEREFIKAREIYLKALEADSSFYKVMTYIGQTYGIEKDFDTAIAWYKRTIALNYIDYMAHWFLADAYKVKGDLDKALDEITIAMILNRNNPRIEKSLKSIYALKKLDTDDWTFTPQIEIESVGENNVKIAFGEDWLGYAMVKALWNFEPGYKAAMGVEEGAFSTLEEKESLASLMVTFDKKKLKKNPEFKALQMAVETGRIDEFIFYEIVLPEYPFVAYQLPESFINEIKDYVIEVRGKQK